jgi:CRP-like cAMP-binding protein
VKTFQILPNGTSHISGFHFSGDVFGLAEEGRYLETAEAIVPSVVYKIRFSAFETLLSQNASLAVKFLCKLADSQRRKQHHALILDRDDAVGKIAMFLRLLENAGRPRGAGGTTYVPMTRSDIAKYVGLTLEAVSRAVRALEDRGVVKFVDLHHFHVLDHLTFNALSEGTTELPPVKSKTLKISKRHPRIRAASKSKLS